MVIAVKRDEPVAPKRKGITKRGPGLIEGLVDAVTKRGISYFTKNHPEEFGGREEFLKGHTNEEKIEDYFTRALQEIGKYTSQEKRDAAREALYKSTIEYLVSGELFEDPGKKLVLRKGLGDLGDRLKEEADSGWWSGRKARETLKGNEYLDRVTTAFNTIYKMFQEGDYAKRMPELGKALETIKEMGFQSAAKDVLYESGLMEPGKYHVWKKAMTIKTKEKVEYANKKMNTRLSEALAASIIGAAGAGVLLVTSPLITGNVTGISTNINLPSFIWGFALLGTSIALFTRITRSKIKNKSKLKKRTKSKKPVKKTKSKVKSKSKNKAKVNKPSKLKRKR